MADRTIRIRFRGDEREIRLNEEQPIGILETTEFKVWIRGIGDRETQGRINDRLRRIRRGDFGDSREIGEGIWELRLDFGPGYRVYYARWRRLIVVLITGGDKSTQKIAGGRRKRDDTDKAIRLWKEIQGEIVEI